MPITITATYAAVLAILFIAFSFYVSAVRGKTDIGLGDGGNIKMLVAIRRHGNMAEFVPFALILMAFAELMGLGSTWLNLAGLLLVAGRLTHPFGVGEAGGVLAARIAGQLATYAAMLIAVAAIFLLQFA